MKKKHKNNLSFAERKALTKMKHDKNRSIYPFNKGTEFVVIREKDAIQKIEEQIGKSKIMDHDSAPSLLNKFKKELAKLRKENKFGNKTYFKFYPSDNFTELLKPTYQKKNYPMRTIVSTIGTAPYGTSKYLVDSLL